MKLVSPCSSQYHWWEIFHTESILERQLQLCGSSLPDIIPFLFNVYYYNCYSPLALTMFFRSLLCTSSHKWDSHPDIAHHEGNDVRQSHYNRHQKIFSVQGTLQSNHQ
jgi:hypothetical protein